MVQLQYDEKYYIYLDELRESGETNMFGATPFLVKKFKISNDDASHILANWMATFSERHESSTTADITE